MHAFDRQTDGQTDTFLVASPRWLSVQRRKKIREGRGFYITLHNNFNGSLSK